MSLSHVFREIMYGINTGHAIRHGLTVEPPRRRAPALSPTVAATTPATVGHAPLPPAEALQPPDTTRSPQRSRRSRDPRPR